MDQYRVLTEEWKYENNVWLWSEEIFSSLVIGACFETIRYDNLTMVKLCISDILLVSLPISCLLGQTRVTLTLYRGHTAWILFMRIVVCKSLLCFAVCKQLFNVSFYGGLYTTFFLSLLANLSETWKSQIINWEAGRLSALWEWLQLPL